MEMSCLIAVLFHVARSLDTVAEFGSDPTITQQNKAPRHGMGFAFGTMAGSRQCGNVRYKKHPPSSSLVGIQGYTKGHVCSCSLLSLTTDILKSLNALCLGTLL